MKSSVLKPLKNMRGKLNHLHLPNPYILRVQELINSLNYVQPVDVSSLNDETVDSILSLASPNKNIQKRVFHKFLFDLQVHTQTCAHTLPSTIFDELAPEEKKISYVIAGFAEQLNQRQILYLNYALRDKLNKQFMHWNNLHLNVDSPSRADIEMFPSISKVGLEYRLRTLPKSVVMKAVANVKAEMMK